MFHPIRLQTGEYKTEILIDSALMVKYPDAFIEENLNRLFAAHIEYVEQRRMEKHRASMLCRCEHSGDNPNCPVHSH